MTQKAAEIPIRHRHNYPAPRCTVAFKINKKVVPHCHGKNGWKRFMRKRRPSTNLYWTSVDSEDGRCLGGVSGVRWAVTLEILQHSRHHRETAIADVCRQAEAASQWVWQKREQRWIVANQSLAETSYRRGLHLMKGLVQWTEALFIHTLRHSCQ